MSATDGVTNLSALHVLLSQYWKVFFIIAALIVYGASLFWTAYGSALRSIPGPPTAQFTRLWLFRQTTNGKAHTLYMDLHRRYGKIVRVAPNKVSISDPDMIPVIYSISSNYIKSPFYDAFTSSYEGKIHANVFATRDPVWHKMHKSAISQAYSLSSLRQLEPLIDECSALLITAMTDLAGQPIDFGEWLQWYAFDVIGKITFAQTFGFLENRRDLDKVIDGLEVGNQYNTVVGQIPEIHPWLIGNGRLMDFLMSFPSIAKGNPVTTFKKMVMNAMAASQHLDPEKTRGDFLEHLRRVQAKDPKRMPDRDIMSALFTNLFAGSDTTAMALRAIIFFLVKNPHSYQKLSAEVHEQDKQGRLSEFVNFQEGLDMKYLQAVIKEALRLYPGVSYPLERVVPDGGAELCGRFLPAGTVVGMHAWVIHRDKSVFGEDAENFRPERWLDAQPEELKTMDRAFLSFGAGSRTCLGKNISILEVTKLIPQLLRRFDLEWASPQPEWNVSGYWFAKQTGVILRLISKEGASWYPLLERWDNGKLTVREQLRGAPVHCRGDRFKTIL